MTGRAVTDAEARIAEMLWEHTIWGFTGTEVACMCDRKWRVTSEYREHQQAALLPVVRDLQAEALEAAIARVQAVYDLQCPVMPSDHYVGAGAHVAHTWWEKVLGGRLDDLRDRAAALRGEAGR